MDYISTEELEKRTTVKWKKKEQPPLTQLQNDAMEILQRLMREGERIQAENQRLELENTELELQVSNLMARNNKLERTVASLRERTKELERQYGALQERHASLENECDHHRESTLCLADELTRYKLEYKRLKAQSATSASTQEAAPAGRAESNIYHFHPGSVQIKDSRLPDATFTQDNARWKDPYSQTR